MRIQDSAYNNLCVDGFTSLGPGPYYVTFPSQVVNTSIGVVIESGDGSCIGPLPPPFFPDSPINAVAVSRGTGQYMMLLYLNFYLVDIKLVDYMFLLIMVHLGHLCQ
jgi:hypothetical protein